MRATKINKLWINRTLIGRANVGESVENGVRIAFGLFVAVTSTQ